MGRHKSKYYKAWLKECTHLVPLLEPRPTRGARWALEYTMVVPNWRRRDLSNVIKALEDFLADRLGLDDNYNLSIVATKAVVSGCGYVEGTVTIG